MKKSTRTVLAIIVAVVSLVGFTAPGFVLHENGVYGPFVGDNYLTDWSNWKFVVLGLTLCTSRMPRPVTHSPSWTDSVKGYVEVAENETWIGRVRHGN